jgi:hypothetical protein
MSKTRLFSVFAVAAAFVVYTQGCDSSSGGSTGSAGTGSSTTGGAGTGGPTTGEAGTGGGQTTGAAGTGAPTTGTAGTGGGSTTGGGTGNAGRGGNRDGGTGTNDGGTTGNAGRGGNRDGGGNRDTAINLDATLPRVDVNVPTCATGVANNADCVSGTDAACQLSGGGFCTCTRNDTWRCFGGN